MLDFDRLHWQAVLNIKTNLMWQLKTDDGELHDKNKKFTWDEAHEYAKEMNREGWCGYKDWRLPTREELRTLVCCSNGTPQEEAWKHTCGGKSGRNGDYKSPTINQDVL